MYELIEQLKALKEAGPSVQKYGVKSSVRGRSAEAIYRAAKKVKDKKQRKLLNAIAVALEAGEAKEACQLFGKLNAEGRKAVTASRASVCPV